MTQTLHIDPEFKAQIPPLTQDERKQLEENILAEGELLAPILVWNGTIVDGHNRYEILQSHPEIPCIVRNLELETRDEVLVWICKHQLGRRNLTPEQKKFLMGKQYDAEKQADGFHGNQHTRPGPILLVLKMNTSRPPRKPVSGSHGKTISAPVLSAGQHCSRQAWISQRVVSWYPAAGSFRRFESAGRTF